MAKSYKIRQVGKQPMVGVPHALIEALGWELGDKVAWRINNFGELVLRRVDNAQRRS